jgi:hypothetical protein
MFGFRLLPTNSDLIIIKKLFRAANFSGAGGDEKLKIIFNWPKYLTNRLHLTVVCSVIDTQYDVICGKNKKSNGKM